MVEHLICIQRVRSSNLLVSIYAVIAQWLERDTDNVEVPSSSLGGRIAFEPQHDCGMLSRQMKLQANSIVTIYNRSNSGMFDMSCSLI